MTTFFTSDQPFNLIAATLGALTGLTFTPPLHHEAGLAGISAAALIFCLGRMKAERPAALFLCGLLGLVCTRLTVSLVS